MTTHFLMVAPVDPLLIPTQKQQDALVAVLRRLRPNAVDWDVECNTTPSFQCSANLENIFCPRCRADIKEEWKTAIDVWWRRADHRDLSTVLSCCGLATSLDDLDYILPQAFACFVVGIERGGPDFEKHELAEAEAAFGAPLRLFWKMI